MTTFFFQVSSFIISKNKVQNLRYTDEGPRARDFSGTLGLSIQIDGKIYTEQQKILTIYGHQNALLYHKSSQNTQHGMKKNEEQTSQTGKRSQVRLFEKMIFDGLFEQRN